MNESTDIHLDFPCSDGSSVSGPVEVTPLGPNLYRLEETPFTGFVDEAGYGDVIEVVPNINGNLVLQRVVQKSNYKHFDFLLPKVVVESEEFKRFLHRVATEGG